MFSDVCNTVTLFMHAQDIQQHTQRRTRNWQKRMGQNRKGFLRAQIVVTPVSLNFYRFVIKQISAVKTPFYVGIAVSTTGAANHSLRIFSCDIGQKSY
jgi:hypothetical protein